MRLLLVEDDRSVARFTKKGLEAERYSVEVAIDGKQGMEKGLSETYSERFEHRSVSSQKASFKTARGTWLASRSWSMAK